MRHSHTGVTLGVPAGLSLWVKGQSAEFKKSHSVSLSLARREEEPASDGWLSVSKQQQSVRALTLTWSATAHRRFVCVEREKSCARHPHRMSWPMFTSVKFSCRPGLSHSSLYVSHVALTSRSASVVFDSLSSVDDPNIVRPPSWRWRSFESTLTTTTKYHESVHHIRPDSLCGASWWWLTNGETGHRISHRTIPESHLQGKESVSTVSHLNFKNLLTHSNLWLSCAVSNRGDTNILIAHVAIVRIAQQHHRLCACRTLSCCGEGHSHTHTLTLSPI